MNYKNNTLQRTIMEETGGTGVDIVVDNGGRYIILLSNKIYDDDIKGQDALEKHQVFFVSWPLTNL